MTSTQFLPTSPRSSRQLQAIIGFLLILMLSACGSEPDGPPLSAEQERGRRIFEQNCTTCHSRSVGTVIVGPSLAGVGERAGTRRPGLNAEEYIRQSILQPDAYIVEGFSDLMPKNFARRLDTEQLDRLIGYLLILE